MDMKTCQCCGRTMAGYLFPLDSDAECDVCRAERLDREVREAHEARMRESLRK